MTTAAWITLTLLIAMFVVLVWNKFPIWLVFISTLTVAMTLQLASPAALLKGYSNTGVVTVAALYLVAAGMYATGAISLLSERVIGLPKSIANAAAAVIMFSVAVSLSTSLGVNFFPFAMILMSGASSAFVNPAGFQTNLMVQRSGGYVFSDFVKVGFPLQIIVGVVVLLLAPMVYGF